MMGDRHDHCLGQVVEGLLARSLDRQWLLGAVIEVLVNRAFALDAQRNGGVIDLRHVLANDDLILAARPLCAQHTLDLLNFIIIGNGLIFEVQTQAGHAVRRVRHIGGAADGSEHVLGNLLVIDSHVESLLFQLKAVGLHGTKTHDSARACAARDTSWQEIDLHVIPGWIDMKKAPRTTDRDPIMVLAESVVPLGAAP